MEKNSELYDLTQFAQGVVFQAAMKAYSARLNGEQTASQPRYSSLFQIRAGYAESPGWMMAQAAEFDPEPLSVSKFRKRAVYAAPKLSLAILELLASERLLDRKGEDYFLTNEGREIIAERKSRRITPFDGFEPIPAQDIMDLVSLLERVIDASLRAVDPPGTWCLAHSRRRTPEQDAPPLARFIQYCSDLNAFRDDAHMAAYGAHDDENGVAGHVWEAFMYVISEQAKNADDLFKLLAYRGFYTEDWESALEFLCEKDWVSRQNSKFVATPRGLTHAKTVETQTDLYFYGPWSTLDDGECKQFIRLLQSLSDTCAALTQS